MARTAKVSNRHVALILDTLAKGYRPTHPIARFDAYQSSPWSIRIRVIDPSLVGLDLVERDQPIWDLFETLPDETFQRISLLFLLTPEEVDDDPTNAMFEADLAVKLGRQNRAAAKKAGAAAKRSEEAHDEATGRAKKARPGRSTG